MKFTRMLPPACESGASDKNVKQPMLKSLMEVLVLEKIMESLTRKVSTVQMEALALVLAVLTEGLQCLSGRNRRLNMLDIPLRIDQNLPKIFLNMGNDSLLTRLCRRR